MKSDTGSSLYRNRTCPLRTLYGLRQCEHNIKDLPLRFVSAEQEFTLQYSTDIQEVVRDWSTLQDDDLFTQPDFLKILERCGPLRIDPYYLIIYQHKKPIIAAVCCLMPFEAGQNIKLDPTHERRPARWLERLRAWIAKGLNFQVLTVGQLLLTGEHSLIWDRQFPASEVGRILVDGLDQMAQHLEKNGMRIHGLMMKDIQPGRKAWIQEWRQRAYHPMRFEPNMILPLRKEWKSFDNYLEALHSKARMRVKRARKKRKGLELRRLQPEDFKTYGSQMYQMYRSIADSADFNLFKLHPDYFQSLCETLPDRFCCMAYFKEENLVAFYTSFINGEELEAHFLGLDDSANREHQLYLNILLDLLEQGISTNATRVIYARTASEIKSSIGAEAHPLDLYLRATNPLINWLLPTFVDWLAPRTDWQARHPFKTED